MKIKIQDLFFPNEDTRDTTPDNKDLEPSRQVRRALPRSTPPPPNPLTSAERHRRVQDSLTRSCPRRQSSSTIEGRRIGTLGIIQTASLLIFIKISLTIHFFRSQPLSISNCPFSLKFHIVRYWAAQASKDQWEDESAPRQTTGF